MTEAPAPAPVTELSYEQALTALEDVVTRLERGDVPLDESIALYERGAALKERCGALLAEAEMKVAQITKTADGAVGTQPLPGA